MTNLKTATQAPPELSMLSVQGLVKTFGKLTALDSASLDLPAGSVTGLLGRNGSGKTTLIRCAVGLARPDRGTATILGEPAWDLSAAGKERLGYVPQEIRLYGWMKTRHMLEYTGTFYARWNHALVADLMHRWELLPDQRVGHLSPGQLQKLAILLALGHEPELLIFDEPAAALDPVSRRMFLQTLLEIVADSRRTILYSTHLTSDLERLADRVAIMRAGRVIYAGGLDELKDGVKRLRVVANKPLPPTLDLPGVSVLRQRVQGNEALLSVRQCSPELIDQLRRRWDATVEIEDLNLEDIFLELHDA